jgi:putative ABC transport system permease protein
LRESNRSAGRRHLRSEPLGLAGAALLTRVLGKLLFDVKPLDPATFLTVAAVLSGAALIASYIPALRATKVEPGVVLGSE